MQIQKTTVQVVLRLPDRECLEACNTEGGFELVFIRVDSPLGTLRTSNPYGRLADRTAVFPQTLTGEPKPRGPVKELTESVSPPRTASRTTRVRLAIAPETSNSRPASTYNTTTRGYAMTAEERIDH